MRFAKCHTNTCRSVAMAKMVSGFRSRMPHMREVNQASAQALAVCTPKRKLNSMQKNAHHTQ